MYCRPIPHPLTIPVQTGHPPGTLRLPQSSLCLHPPVPKRDGEVVESLDPYPDPHPPVGRTEVR